MRDIHETHAVESRIARSICGRPVTESKVNRTISIDASPAQGFAVLTDPTRFPSWKRGIVAVQSVSGRLDEAGSSYTALMRVPESTVVGRFEIVVIVASYRSVQRQRHKQHYVVEGTISAVSSRRLEAEDVAE